MKKNTFGIPALHAFLVVAGAILTLAGFSGASVLAGPTSLAAAPDPPFVPTYTATATITPHSGCCTAVTLQASAECVPDTHDLYHTSYKLSNSCATSQTATRTFFFEVAPTSSGPWDGLLQSNPANRSYPPGDTTETYYFGVPVYEPYHWFRVRVVVVEQTTCWLREDTSTPALLCPGPSPTPTSTFTPTATPTAVPCDAYGYNATTGGVFGGTALVPGSQCGSCNVNVGLPFPFVFYGQTYNTANLGNEGSIQFVTNYLTNTNYCPMPFPFFGPAMLPHWDPRLDTSWHTSCRQYIGSDCGIYTSVTGIAPNRTFSIEWRTHYEATSQHVAHFGVNLYEGTNRFDFGYGMVSYVGGYAVVGVQDGGARFTTFECQTWGSLNPGLLVSWYPPTCLPPPTSTPTPASATLVGHVIYQGISEPSARNVQPITLTLCIGGAPQDYVHETDSQGFFTATVSPLNPSGTYNWRVKSFKNLAKAGTGMSIPPGGTISAEFGSLRAGDTDNNNLANTADFTRLKGAFGTANNPFTDFNNDGLTNTGDFTLLKGNFGLTGQFLACP